MLSSSRAPAPLLSWLLALPLPALALWQAYIRLDSGARSPWLLYLAGSAMLLVLLLGVYEQYLSPARHSPLQAPRSNATGLLDGVAMLTLADLCFLEPRLGPLWWGLALPFLWSGPAYVWAAGLGAATLFGLGLWARAGWRLPALGLGLLLYGLDTLACAWLVWQGGWYWELLLHLYLWLSGLVIWLKLRLAEREHGSAAAA